MENQSLVISDLFAVPSIHQYPLSWANNVTMNVDRCVSLHNKILTIGWEGRGKDPSALGQSWFEFHNRNHAQDIRHRLSPELIAFLERAWEVGDDYDHSFFYYVAGLNTPSGMLSTDRWRDDRYVTLYVANDIAEHPDGLVYDIQTNTAIIQMTVEDGFTAGNGRQKWWPLETVLEAWLDMIRVGKIKAIPDAVVVPYPKYDPWINVPYSEAMLEESIQAFNELVDAIESRMPQSPQETGSTGLVNHDILDESGIPFGFAYEFIQKAQRPRFKHIAPGLAVPTASTLANQPFFTITPEPQTGDENEILIIPPILLFRSDQPYIAPADHPITGSGLPLSWPYSQIPQYPSGLYLEDVDRTSASCFEDEAKLVLPFGIGARGFARTSDGARFGENPMDEQRGESRDTFADLYQPGYQPFVEMHGVRLVKIMRSWKGMVERGDWSVGEEGVRGGMDEWRMADTVEGWGKFYVPVGW